MIRHDDAPRQEGAGVVQHAAAQAEDFSLRVDRDRHLPVLVALLRGGEKMLAPVLLPFHRTPKLHGGGRNHRLLGVERRLGAEAAADERGDHADRFEIALEQVGERAAAEVRRLGRRPHGEHVGCRVVVGEHGAALERHGAAAMEEHLLLEHVRGGGEGRVRVPVAHRHDSRDVDGKIAVRARGIGPGGLAGVAHRRQHVEADDHGGGGVLRKIAVVRDHDRDGLADIADLVARQRQLRARRLDRRVGHQHRDLAGRHARRQVVGREHRVDARHRARRRRVDRPDPGVRVWAADETGV